MTKRAISLLFTLLFLFLGTATVWGAVVGGTTFVSSTGKLEDVECKIPAYESYSTSLTTYTLSGGFKANPGSNASNLLSHTISGLKNGHEYKVKINIASSTCEIRVYYKNQNGHNQEKNITSGTLEFSTWASAGNISYYINSLGNCNGELKITSIEVTGDIDSQVVSSQGNNICKGESSTFTAIGLTPPISWSFTDKDENVTPLSGNGTTVTMDNITKDGTIKANSLSLRITAAFCGNVHAVQDTIHFQTFNMPNTTVKQIRVDQLTDEDGNGYDIESSYCYGYYDPICQCSTSEGSNQIETLPNNSGPKEEHYVIAKSTENMFFGWWKENGGEHNANNILYGGTGFPAGRDGFMVVNCGRLAYDETIKDPNMGKIFEYTIEDNICTETWYNFSALLCNIDQNPSDTYPTNVRFLVYGVDNSDRLSSEPLLDYPTGPLKHTTWKDYGRSFYSGTYKKFRLYLCNNQQVVIDPSNPCAAVSGSDLGLDNITFTHCSPNVGTYTVDDRTGDSGQACNDGTESYTLYLGHPSYDITEMIQNPYYALMQSVNGGNWELVTKDEYPNTDKGYATVEAPIASGQGDTKYTSFVASDLSLLNEIIDHFELYNPTTHENGINSFSTTITCEIYAIGTSFTTVTMHCNEPRSKQPKAEDIALCGSDDLFDLNSLVTEVEVINPSTAAVSETIKRADYSSLTDFLAAVAAKGELKWYDSNSDTATPISSNVPIATKDYWVSFDQKDASPITIHESAKLKVTLTLKNTYEPILNTNNLTKCLGDVTTDESRTIKVNSYTPADITPTYKWFNVANDGTETQITGATSASYVIPLPTVGVSGKVKVYLESTDACTGSAEAVYSIADNPDFTYNISVPCAIELPSTGVNITLTNISGSNFVTIYRDGIQIKQETLSTGSTEYTYTDMGVSQTAEQVTYKIVLGAGDCSKTTDDLEYDITDTYQYQMTADATDIDETADGVEYHICAGDNVTITINDDFMGSDEQFEWYTVDVNGVESPLGVTGNTYTANGLQETTTFKTVIVPATPGATTCGGNAMVTINVDKKPVFKLAITRPTICHGDTNTVHIDYSDADVLIPANATFNWEAWYNADVNNPSAKGDSYQGEYVATAQNAFKQHTFTNAGKYTFVLTVKNGTCTTTSDDNTTLFWAAGDPNFEVTTTKEKTCGEEVTISIKLNTDKPDDYTAYWTLSNSSEELTGKDISEDLKTISNTVSPNTTTTYTAHVDGTCKATDDITITVDNAATLDIEEVFPVCKNEQVKLELHINGNYDKVVWTPAKGLSNAYDPQPIVTASDINTQQQEYDVIVYSGECEVPGHTTVKINDLPVITELVTTDVPRQIKVDVNGMTPTFTIDQMETVYDVPATVSELPFGWRRIYVKDINDCKTDSTIYIEPVEIKPMPSFSPNGEGAEEREKWTVHNLDQYHSYIVEIFDRYGRRLWEYRTGSFSKDGKNGSEPFGWDGMYNNHQMPSDDYWYLITVEEIRKQYTGHFILKR